MFSKSASVVAVASLAEVVFFVALASRFNPILVALIGLACTVLGFRLFITHLPRVVAAVAHSAEPVAPGPSGRQSPVVDAGLQVVGAGLLIMPGFLTAALGGLLFVPPVRWLLAPYVGGRLERRFSTASLGSPLFRWTPGGPARRGDIVDVTATAKDSSPGSTSVGPHPELDQRF